jgi:hypothetical protein
LPEVPEPEAYEGIQIILDALIKEKPIGTTIPIKKAIYIVTGLRCRSALSTPCGMEDSVFPCTQ